MKIVRTSTKGVKETWGKFVGVLDPGFHCYVPGISRITAVSTRTVTRSYEMGVKTEDNVFCHMGLTVAYRIANVELAHYKIDEPDDIVHAQINDAVRGVAPRFALDRLFAAKDEIQEDVGDRLKDALERYGMAVDSVMVTSIEPDQRVRRAMNDINAAARDRQAALDRAEADKLRIVKEAEADAERRRLQGKGIADMRCAMLSGYEKGIADLAKRLGLTPRDALMAATVAQYIDTMNDLAKSPNAKTIIYPSDACGSVSAISRQFGALFVDHANALGGAAGGDSGDADGNDGDTHVSIDDLAILKH